MSELQEQEVTDVKRVAFFMSTWEDFQRELEKRRNTANSNGWIYFAQKQGLVKIGRTSRAPQLRMKELKTNHPRDYEPYLLHTIHVTSMKLSTAEKKFHVRFDTKRVGGEWFNLTEEDIEEIKQIDCL